MLYITWISIIHLSVYNLKNLITSRKSSEKEDLEKIIAEQAIASGNK